MSDIAVKAENISKYYRLGQINNGTLYADIQSWFARKFGKEDPHAKIGFDSSQSDKEGFWALKDINFEIKQGDRVGIIGRNGAGKSTLLKVISEITKPTTGDLYIKGRVASLLEVGTGFHPEMTGRENIYMNGSILGMKKAEITRHLDEIIAFSELEKYIDTPVKRYSSGMYVRLAFAVAAHLDSEILIADEVLAVGDAAFQKKALGKMNELSTGHGRTVLFVSHQMNAVKSLCNKGIVLEKGRCVRTDDNIQDGINWYLGLGDENKNMWISKDASYNEYFSPLKLLIKSKDCKFMYFDDICIEFEFYINTTEKFLDYGFRIYREGVFISFIYLNDFSFKLGINKVRYTIHKKSLLPGGYELVLFASVKKTAWIVNPDNTDCRLEFRVLNSTNNICENFFDYCEI